MSRWAVLVISQQRIAPVEVPTSRPLIVGRGRTAGLEVKDPLVDERHLSLRVTGERLELDPLGGASGVTVNEVACRAPVTLRAGDELVLGETRLLVVDLGSHAPRPLRLVSEGELMARLDEEVQRAGTRRAVGFALLSTQGLNIAARQALTRRVVEAVVQTGAVASWGEVADDLLGGVVPELDASALEAVLAMLPGVAGPRARTAAASSPRDGVTGDELSEAAFCRLLSIEPFPEEPTVAEAVMSRLFALSDELGARPGGVLLWGRSGVGRATLGRAVLKARGVEPRELSAADGAGVEAWLRAPSQGLLLREAELLTEPTLAAVLALARDRKRLVVVTGRSARAADAFGSVIEVPSLVARPADVMALAEVFLREARGAVGRPRLSLGADARRLIAAYSWPGEVRELRVTMLRAARAAVRDEVGSDALPLRVSSTGPRATLRGALKETERDLLLEALARTRWNVTAAATRLGLPRRTVVYRMARLGLKRPTRERVVSGR